MNSDHAGPVQWCVPGSNMHGFGWKHLLQWFLLPTAWSLPSLKQTFPWVIKTIINFGARIKFDLLNPRVMELQLFILIILDFLDMEGNGQVIVNWPLSQPPPSQLGLKHEPPVWMVYKPFVVPSVSLTNVTEAFYHSDFTVIKHFCPSCNLVTGFFPQVTIKAVQ